MDIKEAYKVMQAACGIGVGDTVKVLRVVKDFEMGWQTSWPEDKSIGITGIATELSDIYGIRIDGDWWFPFFCLEKIESAPHTIAFDGGEPVEVPDNVWEKLKKAMK